MDGLRIVCAAIMALILVTGSVGCGHSRPARFYLLTPVERGWNGESRPSPQTPVIGVGPIRFPEYLDRPQMVRWLDDNRAELAEYDRWAEPLAENFQRVLCENLATLLGTQSIETAPFRSDVRIDLRIPVEVVRCDISADGVATIAVRYAILKQDAMPAAHWVRAESRTRFAPQSLGDAVRALSMALTDISGQIANSVSEQGLGS